MITRRNFLLGMRSTGILALMPPALIAVQLIEPPRMMVGAKGPEFFRGDLTGVANGPSPYT